MRRLTAWPQMLAGERIAIRRCETVTVDADWLAEAEQAVAGRSAPCRLQDRLDDGDQGWWILSGEESGAETVGALSGRMVSLDADANLALVWTWLAIDARWRAYGYGGAAVTLLERAAQAAGASLALAPLPADNGVALYFWLRLGYSPQRRTPVGASDLPVGVAADVLWMRRAFEPNPPA